MKDAALLVAGTIFSLVALMHLVRVFEKAEVRVKNFVIPLWLSVFGFLFSILLAIWMFRSLV